MHAVFDADGHLIGTADERGNPIHQQISWMAGEWAILHAVFAELGAT